MPEYAYKARRRNGGIVKGQISSRSKVAAKNDLLNRGLRPVSLKAVAVKANPAASSGGIGRYIYRDGNGAIQIRLKDDLPNMKELALFTKQMSLMIENGVPLLQALELLKQQQRKLSFQEVIDGVIVAMQKGSTLADAFEPYPKVFGSLYVALIRAGEASGRLDVILRQLVVYIEKAAKIKSQIKSAMAYPTIVVVVAVGVISVLLMFVVPSFAKQFKDNNQQLPALTEFVISISNAMVANGPFIFLGLVGAFIFFKLWKNSEVGRPVFDRYILKMPLIGDVLSKIAIGRFCSTMATMLTSGVSILEALTICASSSGNHRIERLVLKIRDNISEGQSFAEPLANSEIFPKMVASMVAVGESTGTLDVTLAKISQIYDDEVDNAIKTMTSMIEPVMIVVIGGIVGFVMIAMYLPIFDIAGTVLGE